MLEAGMIMLALGTVVLFVVILFGAVEWLDRRGKSHKKPPRKWLRPLGAIARTATYGGIGFAIWMVYPQPKDIFEVPLAEVTLGDILRTFFYALIFFALAAFYVRLTPNWDDDDAWESWESYGLLGGFVATGVAIHYLSRALI